MAGEADQFEGTSADDLDDLNADAPGGEVQSDAADSGADDGEGEETLVIELEGEEGASPAPEKESSVIREMRAAMRARDREIAELRRQSAPPAIPDPGPKPTLESCGWDEAVFEQSLDAWKEAQQLIEAREAEQRTAAQRANESWNADLARYQQGKTALRVPNYQEAEETVQSALSAVSQAVLIKASDNPAVVVAALARHPAKLAELSKIDDPIKLAAAIVKLEGKLKVSTSRRPPEPETVPRGSATPAGRVDQTLNRLEAEADRTGDRTKVVAYKRSLAAKRA